MLALTILTMASAHAVILLDTSDPAANTSAPDGSLLDSGWQYEGAWGGFLGTPIAPHYFISAAHIGDAGGPTFSFQNSSYTVIRSFSLGGSDFLIWEVAETFPTFAPLYTARDETGRHLVVIGRGTQRGGEIFLDGTLRGWGWGSADSVWRWGENDVATIVPYTGHDLIYATFDSHVTIGDHPNECHLSSGDSGGAVFINDSNDSQWKLAGINYAVDDLYTAPDPGTGFDAAIFDARGYYSADDHNPPNFTFLAGDSPIPTGFYASRISSELPWICSVLAGPQFGREGNFLTLTYDKLVAPATDIHYEIEQSTDLVTWTTVATNDEVLASNGDIQTIKSKVDPGSATALFIRLRITRPQL